MRRTAVALCLLACAGVAVPSQAQPVRGLAWALISTTAPGPFQYNSAHPEGGSITVSYSGGGAYTVTIPDLGSIGGVAHAVAVNGNHHCNVASWGMSVANLAINVECYSATGTPTAGDFNIFYDKESRAEAAWSSGYLWAQSGSSALGVPYDASASYSWNSKVATNTVERTAVGRYRATFPALAPLPAAPAVMVTAYGTGNSARCRTNAYRPLGSDVIVDVACDAVDGTAVDSRFTLSFFTDVAFGTRFGYANQMRGGYVYLDQPAVASSTPDLRFQYLSSGQPIRATRIALGRWRVNLPATYNDHYTTAQVSRHGGPGYCTLSPWVHDLHDGADVYVDCHAVDGSPSDGSFVLLYMTTAPVGGPMPPTGGPARAKAWTHSGSPTNPVVSSNFDYNSSGAANSVQRINVGQYRVSFPNLGTATGSVHVNAFDGSAYCKAHSWGPAGSTQEVYVLCFDTAGEPVNSIFNVLFYREGRSDLSNTGFARVMAPISSTSSVYTLAEDYRWNGQGDIAEAQRTAVGEYTVTFPGVSEVPNAGSVIVTPYGATPTRCRVLSWFAPNIYVTCYDRDGTLRDAEFGVSYFTDVAFGAATSTSGDPGGFAQANSLFSASYVPTLAFRLNSVGGTVTATRSSAGTYSMSFGGLKPYNKAIPFVTSFGMLGSTDDTYCRPMAWNGGTTLSESAISVECRGAIATQRDAIYVVTYLTDSLGALPPNISDIADITIGANGSTGPRPFIVGDDATPPGDLIFMFTSSDLALVPPTHIVLGGSGANRSVNVTPASGLTGSSTITIYVYDSSGLVAADAFTVTVVASSPLTVASTGPGTGIVSSSPYGITCGLTCQAYFPTGSTVTLTAIPSADSSFTGWSGSGCAGNATCTVTVSGATGVSANFALLPKTYYLAEGATGSFFDLDIVIANPNAFDVPVEMAFLDAAGNTYPLNFTLAAQRTRTVAVESEVPALANAEVSTIVRSPTGAPLVVERSLFWDASYYGGHTGSAVDGPQTTWYFGEGFQSAPVFDTFILLANANLSAAHVTLTFLRQGGTPVSVTRTVGPTSRSNFWAAELPAELNGWSFATIVTSDIPIIAERAMYFGTPTFNGGHESAGVAAPATNWFHAEGRTGPFFDTYILVANPGLAAAHVDVRFLRSGDTPLTTALTVAPQSRETIYVDGIPGLPNNDVSTEVTSDVPVISERSLYWSGGVDTWYEAHNSFGLTTTGLAWGLAEGRFGFPQIFETYILLTNPTVTPTRVRVTFLRQGARPPIVFEQLLAANARANVDMSPLITAPDFDPAGERFGALIESLDGVGIAVERAMYFSTGGVFWSGGTNATAVKLR